MDVNKYKIKYKNYKKIILISDDFSEIFDKLNTFNFSDYHINLKHLINFNPIISFYEYKRYFIINHKILSLFFKDDFSELNLGEDYLERVYNFIESNIDCQNSKKKELKNLIKNLFNSQNFIRDVIKFYTSENDFIYIINKVFRNIEEGIESLSFFIGPIHYLLVKFLNDNSLYGLYENIILFRTIYINEFDLNIYQMAKGDIICFPSFTSTSINQNFEPTFKALEVNNIDNKNENFKLIFNMEYIYEPGNISPGINIKNFSQFKNEEEILLFPFTFIDVQKFYKVGKDYILKCRILNKKNILEFDLKKGKNIIYKNGLLINI